MLAKIAFVTTAHSGFDDRIFYHQAKSLADKNFQTLIISSFDEGEYNSVNINVVGFKGDSITKIEKVRKIQTLLTEFDPEIIICSEPLAVIAANKYRKSEKLKVKIIYDITEWYPSKKNLLGTSGIKRITTILKLSVFNLFASGFVNGFIFGERYKKFPYKLLFPFKKSIQITYFTDLKYISYTVPTPHNYICLGYTGKISAEKGIFNFINSIKILNHLKPELLVKLKIIGWFQDKTEEEKIINQIKGLNVVSIDILELQKFEEFSKAIQDVDIFFDLRYTDFENQHCLPIKLFYYAACGRPVIYSNLKAIRKEVDISSFGHLVEPENSNEIAKIIANYAENNDYYMTHCFNARNLAETKYNWSIIEPSFLNFINELLKK